MDSIPRQNSGLWKTELQIVVYCEQKAKHIWQSLLFFLLQFIKREAPKYIVVVPRITLNMNDLLCVSFVIWKANVVIFFFLIGF